MYNFLCSQGSTIVAFSIFGRMSQDAAEDSIRNVADNGQIITLRTIRGSGSIRRNSEGGRCQYIFQQKQWGTDIGTKDPFMILLWNKTHVDSSFQFDE